GWRRAWRDVAAAPLPAGYPDPAGLPELRAEIAAYVARTRGVLCRPEEVAAVAALLASDEARFIVGENIVIDGGVSIRMYE
ncbi:MAG: SDR family oxidoreductase, partial [Gammaproteobacteria bacterium]